MQQNIIPTIIIATVTTIIGLMFIVQLDRYVKAKAIDDCMQRVNYTGQVADGGTVTYPLEDEYIKCVADKGYEITR